MSEQKPVPHNIEAEQALLGAILMNNEAFHRAADIVTPEHFYEPVHRMIFEAMAKFAKVGKVGETESTAKTVRPVQMARTALVWPAPCKARTAIWC
mgnify:CR=1 FL=1